ncbi:MAG: hypothetical protein JXM71_11075, partial [Spirochaetales bacterium]|nr:hypothetical protein [Spirochaetales bacterium]
MKHPGLASSVLLTLCLVSGVAGCSRSTPATVPPSADTSVETGSTAQPAIPAPQPGLAVLVEGTTRIRGLPGFSRNAIP